jgi:SAM-dependent methyltransferase
MQRGEYERLALTEDRLWWFRGLRANLIAAGRGAGCGDGARVLLDAGCGTGGFLRELAISLPAARSYGIDLDPGACSMARAKSGRPVLCGSVDALPFAERSLDAIFSADVLCHRGVAAEQALAGFRHCLRPGGVLVLNLPAYRWLFSAHDVAVDNARRYGRGEVLRLLAGAGFARARARYWNSALFPIMVLRRKLAPAQARPASDVALLPAPIDRLFSLCLALERKIMAAGVPLPFGGSILATAVRP